MTCTENKSNPKRRKTRECEPSYRKTECDGPKEIYVSCDNLPKCNEIGYISVKTANWINQWTNGQWRTNTTSDDIKAEICDNAGLCCTTNILYDPHDSRNFQSSYENKFEGENILGN